MQFVILPNKFSDKPVADAVACIGTQRHNKLKTEARKNAWTLERLDSEIRNLADETLSQIVERNDNFRKRLFSKVNPVNPQEGMHTITRNVHDLPNLAQAQIYRAVRDFEDFTEGDDPYGEHDFGVVEKVGIKAYWKIDYFKDARMQEGTDDRVNAYRVLTIMLAEDY